MANDETMMLNVNVGPEKKERPVKQQKKVNQSQRHNDKEKRVQDRKRVKFNKNRSIHSAAKEALMQKNSQVPKKPEKKPLVKDTDDDYDESALLVKKPKLSSTTENVGKSGKASSGKPGKATPGKPVAKQHVISSLFNKNPEIPHVKLANVKQAKENVFSKTKFSDLHLHPHLVSCLDKMCLSDMTEVQQRAIPHVLQGADVLIKSQTGSGKTLSYAVPLIESLRTRDRKIKRSDGVYAVILVPTRELALQSLAVIKKLVQSCIWIVPGMVIGGESRKSEKALLRKGLNILVATPGRLVDHCSSTNSLTFQHLEYLIIDEADRLLDMGFEKDVSQILTAIKQQKGNYGKGDYDTPQRYQSILLSATLSTDVKRLASVALVDPVTVDVAVNMDSLSNQDTDVQEGEEGTYTLPSSLKQYYVITPAKLRLVTLTAFILDKMKHSEKKHKMIVFLPAQEVVQYYYELIEGAVNTVETSDDSSDISGSDDEDDEPEQLFDVFALHGDMEQKYRSEVYRRFADAESGVLLCTDVAARGLDLKHVDWIVQLSPPASTEDYVHRVGRTARIGVTGNALLFLLPSEVKYLDTLNNAKISLQPRNINNVLKICLTEAAMSQPEIQVSKRERRQNKGVRQRPHTVEEATTALQDKLEEWTHNEPDRLAQAKSAYQAFVRSYATYPSKAKDIFHVKFLHLGHLAKSFCLREAPGALTGTATSGKLDKRTKAMKKSAAKAARAGKKRRFDKMSEFASG